jgi:hypothetical protein
VPNTLSRWGSRGSSYSDLYDGRPKHGRLVTKVSKGVINTKDMSFRAYPTVVKNRIIFAATCIYASAKGADGLSLYRLGAAFAGSSPDEVPTGLRVSIDPDVSPKRLSNLSAVTRHSITAYPNAGGSVTLSRPSTDDPSGAETKSRMAALGNLQGYNLSVRSFQNTCRFMALAEVSVNPSVQPGWSMNFSIRADTYVPICMDIFEVLDPHEFYNALDRILAITSTGEDCDDDMMRDTVEYLCQAQVYEHVQSMPANYMERDQDDDEE